MSLSDILQRPLTKCCLIAALGLAAVQLCHAAEPAANPTSSIEPSAEETAALEKSLQPQAPKPVVQAEMKALDLLKAGGKIMYAIGLMGIIALTFFIERMIGLRRSKILPRRLDRELTDMSRRCADLDPRDLYRVCQKYPSAAANVFRALLLKLGRPHAEVDAAVEAARDREGTQLFNNVRWLYLAVSVTPMLGLLGTVWGMIEIFHSTANNAIQGNKTQTLAGGIYVALVATFGGLAVAIPSAFAAHYFESRIQGLFHRIDGLIMSFHPLVERLEGKAQVKQKSAAEVVKPEAVTAAAPRPDAKAVKPALEAKV